MKSWHSLRTRMILAYAGLIAIGFLMLVLLAGGQISRGAAEEYHAGLAAQTSLIAHGLTEPLEHYVEGEMSRDALLALVEGYGGQSGARLTLADAEGRAWLDSEGPAPTGNLSAFPEVRAALDYRVTYEAYADENGRAKLYAAAPILNEDGRILSIVRLAADADAPPDRVAQRWLTLGVWALGLAALAVLAGSWLAASQTRPLEQLRVSALRVAQGDFSQRLPEDRRDEIGELATAFNHMAGQVETMVEEQRAFATNAAHELRTPLTTIRLRSEVLREGNLDDQTSQRYIAEIDDEATRLSNLVNDLFLLSRFDAGRAELGREQIEPQRLARSLINELSPRAARQDVLLTLDAPDDLPALTANQNHLRVVFFNLLDNALKYTPGGGTVSWQLRMENGILHSTTRDTGQGIAPEELPHLYERFYRTDKAHERTVPGTGLGLSLVRSIVRAYGGRITIDSGGVGRGTVAEVWWPVTPETSAAIA